MRTCLGLSRCNINSKSSVKGGISGCNISRTSGRGGISGLVDKNSMIRTSITKLVLAVYQLVGIERCKTRLRMKTGPSHFFFLSMFYFNYRYYCCWVYFTSCTSLLIMDSSSVIPTLPLLLLLLHLLDQKLFPCSLSTTTIKINGHNYLLCAPLFCVCWGLKKIRHLLDGFAKYEESLLS